MTALNPSGQFARAETLRQLRLQLAETEDEQKRHVLLRQIEALEEEARSQADE